MFLIISIDVETPQTPLTKGQINQCSMELYYDNMPYGTSFILEQLNRLNLLGVFFVNAYESHIWGDSPVAQLCTKVSSFGHEIGLHTHPSCMFDKERPYMWQYSLDEQIQILKRGQDLLAKWLPGFILNSHRAGAYGLNADTLIALDNLCINVDSSAFYGHPNCKLIFAKNRIVQQGNIVEIPVTGFWRMLQHTLWRFPLRTRKSFVKTDIDWASLDELLKFIVVGEKHGIKVMNLFMHSYSFVRFNPDYSHFEPDFKKISKLRIYFERINEFGYVKNVTFRDLLRLHEKEAVSLYDQHDYVPEIVHKKALGQGMWQRFQGITI